MVNNTFPKKLSTQTANDLDFIPTALSGFIGVVLGYLIASCVGII